MIVKLGDPALEPLDALALAVAVAPLGLVDAAGERLEALACPRCPVPRVEEPLRARDGGAGPLLAAGVSHRYGRDLLTGRTRSARCGSRQEGLRS